MEDKLKEDQEAKAKEL